MNGIKSQLPDHPARRHPHRDLVRRVATRRTTTRPLTRPTRRTAWPSSPTRTKRADLSPRSSGRADWSRSSATPPPRATTSPSGCILGDAETDGFVGYQYQNPTVFGGHAWVVSYQTKKIEVEQEPCFLAYKDADPQCAGPRHSRAAPARLYERLRQLFTGIQVAGPQARSDLDRQGLPRHPEDRVRRPRHAGMLLQPRRLHLRQRRRRHVVGRHLRAAQRPGQRVLEDGQRRQALSHRPVPGPGDPVHEVQQ